MTVENVAKEIVEKHKIPSCHSDFQIENFIIGKEYNSCGKIWQCVREIQARVENLQNYYADREDQLDELELAEIDAEELRNKQKETDDPFATRKNAIFLRKSERKITKIKNFIKKLEDQKEGILKELNVLVNLFNQLVAENGYREFEDLSAQLEYWQSKFEKELLVNQFLGLPMNPELIKSCLALPCDTPVAKQIKIAFETTVKKLTLQNN